MTEHRAVVDRFEGDWAVLLLSDNQQLLNVPRSRLPRRTREGHYLKLVVQDGEVTEAVIDIEETRRAKQRIKEKLNRLRQGEHLDNQSE